MADMFSEFDRKLFAAMLDNVKGTDGNMVMSLYNTKRLLYLAMAGMKNQTLQEAVQVTGLDASDVTKSRMAAKLYADMDRIARDAKDPKNGFNFATESLVMGNDKYVNFVPAFTDYARQMHKAFIDNFTSPADAMKKANEFVNQATKINPTDPKGMIPVLWNRPPEIHFALIAAMMAKGQYATPFAEKATKPEDFMLPGGQTQKVNMMNSAGEVEAHYSTVPGTRSEIDESKPIAIRLNYRGPLKDESGQVIPREINGQPNPAYAAAERKEAGKPLPFSSVFILPPKGQDLKTWAKVEGLKFLGEAAANFKPLEAKIALPRVDASTEVDLKKALEDTGLKGMFTKGPADLSGMVTAVDKISRPHFSEGKTLGATQGNEDGNVTAVVDALGGKRSMSGPPTIKFDRGYIRVDMHRDIQDGKAVPGSDKAVTISVIANPGDVDKTAALAPSKPQGQRMFKIQ